MDDINKKKGTENMDTIQQKESQQDNNVNTEKTTEAGGERAGGEKTAETGEAARGLARGGERGSWAVALQLSSSLPTRTAVDDVAVGLACVHVSMGACM